MVANGSSSRHRRSSSSTTPSSSTKRRTSSTTHEKKKVTKPMGICSFCLGDEEKNAKGVPEDMISCSECGNCGHPSCLKYSDKLVEKIKTIRWQCLDCKKCYVCNIGDDSLLFCDVCDAAIHPKCCTPPLNHIPKGVFTCPNCRHEKTIKSTRSLRNKTSSDEETPTVITRPVAQLIDGMSNFFLPKKDKNNKNNNQRQQSVQKAMKYLRNKTSKSPTRTNQLLARTILTSSKTSRIKRKPAILTDESSPNSQQTIKRRSTAKTSPVPTPVRSNEKSPPVIPKRKQSISPVSSHTPVTIKKRSKTDSIIKKTPSKRKENKNEQEDESDNDEEKNKQQKISTVNKRKLNLDLSKYKTPPSFLNDALPDTINTTDVYLFLDARKNSSKLISDASDKFHHTTEPIEEDANNPRWPPYIVFGDELIKTWYSSSYPQEYARVPCLFICEFCLKYMKCEQVYDRHRKKCQTFHPPANEIYHKDDLSVFEVDGNINRIYCQNLCLLAKLFLDHKTLYYDVEPFLFYVLTKNDSNGCHFLGYFSKEKHCPQKYNLSCITVLPHCQRRGYGRLLIELSYLLSQKEGQIGTPERPLSTHGAQTYEAYWQIKIVEQLLKYYRSRKEKCTLKELMNETGITIDDIIDTLQNLGVLTMQSNEKPVIHADITQLENIMNTEKLKHAHWISLDGEFLRFTPVLKPILFLTDGNSNENQPEQIEIVFKKIIESDTSDSTKNPIESGDGSTNNPESVRYIRRRKFGRKRRSIYVKCRVSNKTESNATTHEDEHSQEYIARRQDESSVDESTKDGEDDSEQIPSPVNPISNQPKFKQLTLDQFLKKIPVNKEKKEEQEEPIPEVKTEEEVVPKRTKRLSSSHVSKSETDLSKIANGTIEDIVKKPLVSHHRLLVRQTSDGTMSSNDSSPSPLPFKKRAWTSSNIQALIDPPINPKKSDHPVLSRETSIATPSSVSDTSANPLMTSSSSVNSTTTDDETKIARIESQLKTTIQPVEDNDDQPPSLTSPTSMIVSQSNHYNYPTRSSVAKQQQQQSITINNFNTSTNMTYNYGQTSYPYPYPPGPPPPTMDMQSFYYSPPMSMNYMPYYPTSTSPMYPSGQPLCYQPNGTYPNNSSPSYNYSTSQSSSSSSSSNRRH